MARSVLCGLPALAAATLGLLVAQSRAPVARDAGRLRGYTVMAGGLGRSPGGETDMWSNTADAHLAFIDQARINLVAVEVPYGIDARHPKSPAVVSFLAKLRARHVKVWILYPHALAEAFDLPRQVDADGKEVSWNCCFNRPEVQDWLVDNGRRLVAAYEPDGLLLFGTFHQGGACHCPTCKESRDARSGKTMEQFFVRWREACRQAAPRLELGTCDFWSRPSRRTLECVDFVCPVVPIFRPDYAKPGQVKGKASGWRASWRDEQVVPYVKLFLASQTDSATEDLLAAAREATEHSDGFLFWGYNPGHSYARQDYDHDRIAKALLELAKTRPAAPSPRGAGAPGAADRPILATEATRADPAELARLERPGTVLFTDGFEADASLRSYFELGGAEALRVQRVDDAGLAHSGKGVLQLTSTASDGRSCGASAVLWLGDEGHDCVHLRYWIRYADDYDQGNLHHTGGSLEGVAGSNKWAGMGTAGLRPKGDDRFSTRVEGWRDWQRVAAPGFLHCYTYWMDMQRDKDGHYWGNMLGPAAAERKVPARGRWQCVELRVAANTKGKADGELAVWLDGRLYLHYRGLRWRSSDTVRIKRATLMVYVHEARRDNRVSYDDVVVSTGYVGPGEPAAARGK